MAEKSCKKRNISESERAGSPDGESDEELWTLLSSLIESPDLFVNSCGSSVMRGKGSENVVLRYCCSRRFSNNTIILPSFWAATKGWKTPGPG